MSIFWQGVILTFFEAYTCLLFFDIFTEKRAGGKTRKHMLFALLFLGFLALSLLGGESFFPKAVIALLIITLTMYFYYKSSVLQALFLAAGFYALAYATDWCYVKKKYKLNREILTIMSFFCGSSVNAIC